jgi:hypothetical protein
MKYPARIGAFLVMLSAGVQGLGSEPHCAPPGVGDFVQRVGPVGGWDPYGGCLLRWWKPSCFPRCGGPDDYCRKPLPRVCWPPYPSYYIWGPPEVCHPPSNGCRDCHQRH